MIRKNVKPTFRQYMDHYFPGWDNGENPATTVHMVYRTATGSECVPVFRTKRVSKGRGGQITREVEILSEGLFYAQFSSKLEAYEKLTGDKFIILKISFS